MKVFVFDGITFMLVFSTIFLQENEATGPHLKSLLSIEAAVHQVYHSFPDHEKCDGFQVISDFLRNHFGFENNESLYFAFYLKKIIKATQSGWDRQRYESMKSRLPDSIQNIIWGEAVQIRSTQHNKNVKALSNGFVRFYDGDSDEMRWTFITDDCFLFKIKDKMYGKYLYSPGSGRDVKANSVLGNVDQPHWKIEIKAGNEIMIRSTIRNEIMFCSYFQVNNNNFSALRTWKPSEADTILTNGFWKVLK